MRSILLLCAAASLLGLPSRAAASAASPDARPALQQIRIVPATGPSGALARVIVAGVSASQTREWSDPQSLDHITEILSSTGDRLAVVTDRPSPVATRATRKVEAADGRALPVIATATATSPESPLRSESPSSTVSWRGADGSLTTIAAYGDAAIELVAGPANDPTATAAASGEAAQPFEFVLLPVAGNPVRGSAALRFRLPEPGKATLELFDVAGRRVSRLLDESLAAGEHSVPFRSQALPPGRYCVRLTFAGSSGVVQHTATRSVVVLR